MEQVTKDNISMCGATGFTIEESCLMTGYDRHEAERQFYKKEGEFYAAYMEGRLQAELDVRQAVLQSAKNGSTPSQQQLLALYASADEDIYDAQTRDTYEEDFFQDPLTTD